MFITIIGNVFPNRSYLALGGICTGIGEISAGYDLSFFYQHLNLIK